MRQRDEDLSVPNWAWGFIVFCAIASAMIVIGLTRSDHQPSAARPAAPASLYAEPPREAIVVAPTTASRDVFDEVVWEPAPKPITPVVRSVGPRADDVRVSGYYRRDGTYVRPHMRSRADGDFYNNYSTKGNVNPYTGKAGTRRK